MPTTKLATLVTRSGTEIGRDLAGPDVPVAVEPRDLPPKRDQRHGEGDRGGGDADRNRLAERRPRARDPERAEGRGQEPVDGEPAVDRRGPEALKPAEGLGGEQQERLHDDPRGCQTDDRRDGLRVVDVDRDEMAESEHQDGREQQGGREPHRVHHAHRVPGPAGVADAARRGHEAHDGAVEPHLRHGRPDGDHAEYEEVLAEQRGAERVREDVVQDQREDGAAAIPTEHRRRSAHQPAADRRGRGGRGLRPGSVSRSDAHAAEPDPTNPPSTRMS